jgi:hypothetical protein
VTNLSLGGEKGGWLGGLICCRKITSNAVPRLLTDMEIWHALTVVGFEERGVQWISFLC